MLWDAPPRPGQTADDFHRSYGIPCEGRCLLNRHDAALKSVGRLPVTRDCSSRVFHVPQTITSSRIAWLWSDVALHREPVSERTVQE